MIRFVDALAPLVRKARLFAKAREAVAAVEFALVLPIMLTMYLGATELSQVINVDQRVTVIAGTVGDLVARANGEVTATSLTDYFQAATAIIAPFSTTGLTQIVTLVSVSSTGVVTVKWSEGYNGGVAYPTGPFPTNHPLPSSMISLVETASTPYMIISEASYSYTPLLGLFFKTPFQLYHQNFYLPRYPAIICYDQATCT